MRRGDDWLAARIETVRAWANRALVEKDASVLRAQVLYDDYVAWMERLGRAPASRTVWGTYMGRHYSRSRYSGVFVYRGVAFNPMRESEITAEIPAAEI